MISNDEYLLLMKINESQVIDEIEYANELRFFLKEKLIKYNVVNETATTLEYSGFNITIKGKRAIEEYELNLQKLQRESESLNVAREANTISKKSKNISLWALLISTASLVLAIVSAIAVWCGVL